MSDIDKLKNILSFLCILFHEKHDVMETVFDLSPEYIMEKYERYVKADRREWTWGMHPSIKRGLFVTWLKKYGVEFSEEGGENW